MIRDQLTFDQIPSGELNLLLPQARQYLLSVHSHLVEQKPGQFAPTPPPIDQLLGFTAKIQAQVLANQTLIDEEGTEKLVRLVESMLAAVTGLLGALEQTPTHSIADINWQTAEATLEQEERAALAFAEAIINLLSVEVPRSQNSDAVELTYWLPLTTLKGKGSDELYRIIVNMVPTDPQVRRDVRAFLESTLRIAATNKALEDQLINTETLSAMIDAPELLEAVAAPMGMYISKSFIKKVGVYDDEFLIFYRSLVAYLRRTMPSVSQKSAAGASIKPTKASTTTPQPQSAPISQPSKEQARQIPISTQPAAPTIPEKPAPVPGATVDLRHPAETPPAQTPLAPEAPTDQQSKIKPINIS